MTKMMLPDADKNPGVCLICERTVDERCPDGNCRACHQSLSWEDCCDGTWNARLAVRNGHPQDEVKKLWPNARI